MPDNLHHKRRNAAIGPSETGALVREFYRNRSGRDAAPSALAEAALFVEDVFSIPVRDDDIRADTLGSAELMAEFVLQRQREGEK